MKKEWMVIVIAFVIVSGCQQLGFGRQTTPETKPATFIGGTQGLEIAFSEDQPPDVVLDNNQESFQVSVLIRNKGEYDIPANNLIASLSGIVQSTFGLASLNTKNDFEIYGVAKEGEAAVPGAEEIISFGQASFKTDLPGDTTFTLRADVCYNYQTKAVTKVCLKKEPLKPDKIGAVCQIASDLAVENSGAPIHVENVRESTVGGKKVKITFRVVNKGLGAVFEPNTFTNACVGQEEKKDQLKLTATNPERSFAIECPVLNNANAGTIKLVNKVKDVTCTMDTTNMQDVTFQDLIIVQLDYMYRQAVQIPLRISSEG